MASTIGLSYASICWVAKHKILCAPVRKRLDFASSEVFEQERIGGVPRCLAFHVRLVVGEASYSRTTTKARSGRRQTEGARIVARGFIVPEYKGVELVS
jgi:hypothetical protein